MMNVLPRPAFMQEREGSFLLSYDTWVCMDVNCGSKLSRQAAIWLKALEKRIGFSLMLTRGKARKGDIRIRMSQESRPQSYELMITEDGIDLSGAPDGIWYGMQTLLQIVQQCGGVLPALTIKDEPVLPNRGYYFDVTRGRIPTLDWLKELADRMAFYKLNQLQLYVEHTYLFRDITELWRDDTPLTANEILEFDAYCAERGIELVPSLASFGHLYKLLSTKSYAHLCELEDSDKEPFSIKGRMQHHTINASDPRSIALIKSMIEEYMELFSSRQFNLCADETMDMGKGRGQECLKEKGKAGMYIGFVKEIAEFLLEKGRRPMFWGDIILNFPEAIKELPKEIICLNWGYGWDQTVDNTLKMKNAQATQYCCPGCAGWNQFVNQYWTSYENIRRQCLYACEHGAIGILNTDWGDYMHINHPDFSRAGMIYAAAMSWNQEPITFEEINRQISCLEYEDNKEDIMALVSEISNQHGFAWEFACMYREKKMGLHEFDVLENWLTGWLLPMAQKADEKNAILREDKKKLLQKIAALDSAKKELLTPYLVAVDGMMLFSEVGKYVLEKDYGQTFAKKTEPKMLAAQLETWLYFYKKEYRKHCKERELRMIEELVCWYGDFLREY